MIKAFHMDDRLIHGQVAISWTRHLSANVILIMNDALINDKMRREALKLGLPAGVKVAFRTVEDGIAFLNGPEGEKYDVMALVNNPQDARKVCENVPAIAQLTIGGIRKNAPYVSDNLNLTAEDVQDLKAIIALGKPVGMRPTPRHNFLDLTELLDKAEQASK